MDSLANVTCCPFCRQSIERLASGSNVGRHLKECSKNPFRAEFVCPIQGVQCHRFFKRPDRCANHLELDHGMPRRTALQMAKRCKVRQLESTGRWVPKTFLASFNFQCLSAVFPAEHLGVLAGVLYNNLHICHRLLRHRRQRRISDKLKAVRTLRATRASRVTSQ